jgi:hypothetical protein
MGGHHQVARSSGLAGVAQADGDGGAGCGTGLRTATALSEWRGRSAFVADGSRRRRRRGGARRRRCSCSGTGSGVALGRARIAGRGGFGQRREDTGPVGRSDTGCLYGAAQQQCHPGQPIRVWRVAAWPLTGGPTCQRISNIRKTRKFPLFTGKIDTR